MATTENVYQGKLIRKLKRLLPGCVIQKLDSGYQQGIPDLLILHGNKWAVLEVKKDAKAEPEVNQPYWVEKLNGMSFGAFIYPENEREVLDALQRSLGH